MTIDMCNGEPSIGNHCPQKQICRFYLDYEAFNPKHSNDTPSYISAFYCSSKNWHKFEEIQPFDMDPLLILTNKMVIRFSRKHSNPKFDIYRIVLPKDAGRIAYDGKSFYKIDQITSEPLNVMDGIHILNQH